MIKLAVRARFKVTGREKASEQIRKTLDAYLALASSITPGEGMREITVPPMLGVDEDMSGWSFYMILEHNVIVNRSITEIVRSLALGEEPGPAAQIDPKSGVMPSPDPGAEQVDAFCGSVEDHLKTVADLPKLKGTARKRHPIFGKLDAHGWHCMFGLHLEVHLKQAQAVLDGLKNDNRNIDENS